jgi:Domain of unknown function (DUF4232)
MGDVEERLRETLRRHAVGVPPRLEVPAGLVHRAGMRIARNLSVVALVVAIVALGAVTGLAALNHSSRTPSGLPSPQACQATHLSGETKLDALGNAALDGWVVVTNTGDAPCALQGAPSVMVLGDKGSALNLRSGQVDPFWKIRGMGPPPGWPVAVLQPGASAGFHIYWNSWCGQKNRLTWAIGLPGGDKFSFPVDLRQDVPICSAGRRSTLKVGPFEPYTPHT